MQTFIVRIAPAEQSDDGWHGIVRRVDNGDEQPFHGSEELLDLMRGGRDDHVGTGEQVHD